MASWGLSMAVKLLFVLVLFGAISTCSPITSDRRSREFEGFSANKKRQGGFFSVLGVAGLGDATPHPRLEIRQLSKNQDQWNVYMLGLQRFQNVSQSDKLSYYQIAGIHGRPYIAWDGVGGVSGGGGGYCQHGSNIFPTWHRPYLALFEELLYLNARQAISEFPAGELKDRYNNALSTLRIPYWDWAAVPPSGEGSFPWFVQRQTVDVILPTGPATIPNPLYAYRFHPIPTSDFESGKWVTWPTTFRDPSSENADATSRNDLVALELDKNRPNLQSRVYNLLAFQHDYFGISNDLRPGENIESIHDTIHNTVGSDGHMTWLAYSAFDPIFWLHHANVDRLFAIWQALNPNSYVNEWNNPYATFTYPGNSKADMNTPLHPFHKDDSGTFWTSDGIRSPSIFGYTYPELVNLNPNDTAPLVSKVNALYGPNATPQNKRSLGPRAVAGAPNFAGQRQYVANIKVHKFGLDGSFNVYVFLGSYSITSRPRGWAEEASFIGVTGMLSQQGYAAMEKAEQDANGAVPLTAALEAKVRSGELESLKEDRVAAYLKENLSWKVAKTDGEVIDVANAPGFQLSILWAEIQPAASANEFPHLVGEYQILLNATNGRTGGFQEGDVF